ncbi:hypothetical protein [Lentzea flava]|uniref:hypothetical protein n=1 Tax=Lentzea flava TaxID=103732 RepID=UPI0016717D93|nr:hypothetical protein [Lentzea flava]MCP2200062.1 hypothetical protein [Lentzea flava]
MSDTTLNGDQAPAVEQDVQALPQWARDAITTANDQAARYRIAAREAGETARAEVTAEFEERISALTADKDDIALELGETRLALSRLRIALDAGIPGESAVEFAALLKGSDEDELRDHAEKVKAMFGVIGTQQPERPVDHSQGLGREDVAASPAEAFGAFIRSQLHR